MITALPPSGSSPPSPFETPRQTPTAPASTRGAEAPGAQTPGTSASGADRQATAGERSAQLSEADQQRVRELQQRDREVRAHELAHVAAGAGLILRGASFTYETGPDGQRYAVGGEVTIDTSPGRTPEETLSKASRIKAAALAPADPSPQDRQVASQADMMAADARAELAQQTRAESAGTAVPNASSSGDNDEITRPFGPEQGSSAQRMRIAYADAAIAGTGLRDRTFSAFA